MRVIYKPTGQLGDIPDDKFDPSLFSVAGASSTTNSVVAPTTNPMAQQAQQSGIDPAVAYNMMLRGQTGGGASSAPTQTQPVQQPQAQNVNPVVNTIAGALPTVGGILGGVGGALIPGLGETGIGEVGGAAVGQTAGRALENLLTGQNVTSGLPEEAVGGAIGGGIGLGVGKVVGGLFSGLGEDLASGGLNMTKGQLAKFKQQYGQSVSQVLKNNGLAGVNPESLEEGISKLDQQYGNIAKSNDIPVNQATLLDNINKARNSILNPTNTEGVAANVIPSSAQKTVSQLDAELQSNVYKPLGITQHEDGSLSIDPNNQPTLGDLQQIKQSYANQTTPSQWSADPGQYGINRLVGNVIRKTMNDTADTAAENGQPILAPNGQTLGGLGKNLMMLKDALDTSQKRIGVGQTAVNPFGWGNEVLSGIGISAANALGANPLTGLLLPAGRIFNRVIRESPTASGALSSISSGIGNTFNKAAPALGIAGVLGAGGIAQSLTSNNVSQNTNSNPQTNTPNQGGLPPTATTVNNASGNVNGSTTGTSGSPTIIQQNVNGINIPVEKETGHLVLPDLNASVTQIPGLPFDEQKINAAIEQYGNNPYVMSKVQAAEEQNKLYAQQYLQNHQLDSSEVDFMRNAGPVNDQINQLSDLLKDKGNQNVFQSIANDSPLIRAAKLKMDPSGTYAQMLSLMTTLQGQAAKSAVGGRLSNFDIQFFGNMPQPGDTAATAQAKIKQAQSKLYDQYSRLYPAYGLSLNAAQTQASQQQIQQQNPQQGFNALQSTLYAAPQGGGQ